jgi:hypothetical protein
LSFLKLFWTRTKLFLLAYLNNTFAGINL